MDWVPPLFSMEEKGFKVFPHPYPFQIRKDGRGENIL
jgi:hypothetical protein